MGGLANDLSHGITATLVSEPSSGFAVAFSSQFPIEPYI